MDRGQSSYDFPTMDDLEDENLFVPKAVKLVAWWYDYFNDNNRQARDDIYFLTIDQWSPQDRAARTLQRKPVLTFNYLRPILNQLVGEQRTQEPDIIVEADSLSADPKQAQLFGDLIREVYYENDAPIAFQTAFKYALMGGYSAIFHDVDYKSPKVFDKVVRLRVIENFTSAFFDPSAKEADKSDSRFMGYFTDLSKDEFQRQYPKAESINSFPTFRQDPLYYNYWYNRDYIRVADMWVKLQYKEKVVQLSDGSQGLWPEMKKKIQERENVIKKLNDFKRLGILSTIQPPEPLTIMQERMSDECFKIFHVRMNYSEILELEEWPSDEMPGVFLDCESTLVDGRQRTMSFFRMAHDAQRYLNYLRSESAEAIMNAHHGNWMGTPENVKGDLIKYWVNPGQSKSILLANYDEKGNLPQFTPPPQISPALETQATAVIGDIQNVIGRYEASMGKQGNEQSGVAVDKRAMYGSLSSFEPFDNLKRCMARSGKIVLSLLPYVYDETRSVRIRKKSGDSSLIQLNQPVAGKYMNSLESVSDFRVKIEVGASFAVQKMANFQMMMQLIQANPQVAPVVIDLMAANLDIENVQEIVTRLKATVVPPAAVAAGEGKQPPPPSKQQQMLQMMPLMMQAQEMKIKQGHLAVDQAKLQLQQQQLMQDKQADMAKEQVDIVRARTELAKARLSAESSKKASSGD
jgi:hypothetical protein